jgi:hypothetical protein
MAEVGFADRPDRRILTAMAEDDDRPGDASSAANASWADVVVPDDISALVADVEAYRREVRRARRRAWQSRLMSRPGILPLSIVSIALLLAGLVATLLTVLGPSQRDAGLVPRPLAHTTTADGKVGGLLPAVRLSDAGQSVTVQSRALRPSVVALVPANCDCTARLNSLSGQANEINYPLDVVIAADAPGAAGLSASLTAGKPRVLLDASDPKDSLYAQAHAVGLTILLVKQNGQIYQTFPNVDIAQGLKSLGAQLVTMRSG